MSPSNPYDSGVKGQDPNVPTFVHLAMCKTEHISVMLEDPGDKFWNIIRFWEALYVVLWDFINLSFITNLFDDL